MTRKNFSSIRSSADRLGTSACEDVSVRAGGLRAIALASCFCLLAFGCGGSGGDSGGGGGTPDPGGGGPTTAPSNLSYSGGALFLVLAEPLAPIAPVLEGVATSFSVTPTLPAGITLDPTSGILAGVAVYAYDAQYNNRILPNVHVGSVDLSGMTSGDARQALAGAYQGYGEGNLTVHIADRTVTIPYAEIDRRADIDAMLRAAFAVGRAPAPVERLLGELRTITKGVTLQPSVVLDAAKLQERIRLDYGL